MVSETGKAAHLPTPQLLIDVHVVLRALVVAQALVAFGQCFVGLREVGVLLHHIYQHGSGIAKVAFVHVRQAQPIAGVAAGAV